MGVLELPYASIVEVPELLQAIFVEVTEHPVTAVKELEPL